MTQFWILLLVLQGSDGYVDSHLTDIKSDLQSGCEQIGQAYIERKIRIDEKKVVGWVCLPGKNSENGF